MNFQIDTQERKIIVHVPVNFRTRGGKKVLVGPKGQDLRKLDMEVRKDEKLLKALGRAYKWQKQIALGKYQSARDIEEAEKINHSYVRRVMRMMLLTGVKVRFGPGFVLELEKSQADARAHVLHHKKGSLYAVLDTVEFKQGEIIGISEGDIPKSWWDTLEEVSGQKAKFKAADPTPPDQGQYTIKHRHFGKYDVIDLDGNTVTEEPLPKDEALAYLDELSGEAET